MKKHISIILIALLAGVSTAWGQYDRAFTATYNIVNDLIYNGQEQTGVNSITANCSYNMTGDKATAAGTHTCTIVSNCSTTHTETDNEGGTVSYKHIGSVAVSWTIAPRDISKTTGYNDNLYVAITVKDQKWTGAPIELTSGDNGIYTIKFNDTDLTADDVDVYVTKENSTGPVTILDEGRYTIVFTGKGNFTGTVTKTFDVKKEMADPAEDNGDVIGTGIYFYIPTQILIDGKFTGLKMEAKDQKSHATLYEGKDVESEEGDYLLVYFEKKADAEAYATAYNDSVQAKKDFDNGTIDEAAYNQKRDAYRTAWNKRITNVTETINKESRYWFVAVGIAPKYQGTAIHEFYTANEYQTYQGSNVDGRADVNLRIVEPGYPVAETSPTGEIIKGKMEVAPKATSTAQDDENLKTLTIGSGSDAVTVNYVEGDKWEKVVERNSDELELKPGDTNIYKKGTNAFVMYNPDGSGNDNMPTSATTGDTINSTTHYWWESIQ